MSDKVYERGHFRKKPSVHKEEEVQNIDYYYQIVIDSYTHTLNEREAAIDELKQLGRKGSEQAKKRLMDIRNDSWRVPSFLRERARDC